MCIFGGSGGIGLAVAKLASQEGASTIYICGRNEERLASAKKEIEAVSTASTNVVATSVDSSDEAACRAFADSLPDRSIDHLVTTPGGSAKLGNLVANKRNCDDVRKQA